MAAIESKDAPAARITNISLPEERIHWNMSSVMEQIKHQQLETDYNLVPISKHEVIVEFQEGSPINPTNWTFKMYNAITGLLVVINSGLSSSLPSNAAPEIMKEFGQPGIDEWSSLPNAVFLVGYIVGSVTFSPLSETVGRKPVLLGSLTLFVLMTLACSLAQNWASLLVFRAICGLAGAVPQSVVGGVYADMFFDVRTRGRAMASYMSASSCGPILGTIISGCSIQYGWRWTFRIELILAACTWVAYLFTSETFEPVILKRKASQLRRTWNCDYFYSRAELQSDFTPTKTEIITRPIQMLFCEPIVLSTTIYIAFAYSLVFVYLQAYPIIFKGVYGFDSKNASLTFIPIGLGAMSSGLATFCYDTYYERNTQISKIWATSPELHRLPCSCLSGPCLTISIFWLSWTARSSIPWAVPMMSGLFFGFGYQIVFTSLLTYTTDAYKIYSASALAASLTVRSIVGALLPFAVNPLYNGLGVSWATSILGFASLACIPIPFVLMRYGSYIRKTSPFCQRLLLEYDHSSMTSRNVLTTPSEV